MSDEIVSDGNAQEGLTSWDKRVVRAIETADHARTGVKLLRAISLLIVGASVIGNYMVIFDRQDEIGDQSGIFKSLHTNRLSVGEFLTAIAGPCAFAALVFAASLMLSVYASRLDMDIVIADEAQHGPD